jgi:hypothetical protein
LWKEFGFSGWLDLAFIWSNESLVLNTVILDIQSKKIYGGGCLTEKVEFTSDRMEKVRQAAMHFRDTVTGFFKEHSAELKDWRFAVESGEAGYLVDVSVKVLIKPKSK